MSNPTLYAFDENYNRHEIDFQSQLTFDTTPTQGSTNPVTSGGIYTALTGKQNTLTFDSAPQAASDNPVKSSGIYAALTGKQATITGGASTITGSNLTASRALISNSSGKVAVSTTTSAELSYLSGVTSSVQTQLNGKATLNSPTFTGTPKAPTAAAGTNSTQIATTAFVQNALSGISSVALFG